MPRANRYFLPGYAWHITHRCHKKEFLLKFSKDRQRWLRWLFEAKKRYGLCILNYIVTSNHIHLLVLDEHAGVIAKSMQLIAGRTAQEYNQRKVRKGAYWEDRYHATAVQTDEHLARCLTYIDLNMVRAGVVSTPTAWKESGLRELHHPPKRYGITNIPVLMKILGFRELENLQQARSEWIASQLIKGNDQREPNWSECLAMGDQTFIEEIKKKLGSKTKARDVIEKEGTFMIKEDGMSYTARLDTAMDILRENNAVYLRDY